jgi:hypothetical protein
MAPVGTYDYGWWNATILNILLFSGFVLNGIQLSVTSSLLIPCGTSLRMRFQEDL